MNSTPSTRSATAESAPRVVGGPPAPPAESRVGRLVRSAALLGLAFVAVALLCLAVLAATPLGERFAAGDSVVGGATLGCLLLAPPALVALAARLRLHSWRWAGGGALAVAPILTYLAIDDPVVLHPTTMEEIAPSFPGAEKSYAVLMQYSKQHPSEEAKAFAQFKPRIQGMPANPDQPGEWIPFLEKNRAAIEADWADLAPQRRWLAEVNAFDRIGDLGEASPEANIITFQVWRLLSQRALHVAGLRMLDGQPDAAIATLLPMLQAGRKIQPSARSLVRFMIGIVVEKMTILYALNITERAALAPETRAKLAAALAGGVRGEAGARRLVGIENAFALTVYYQKPIGDLLADFPAGGSNSGLKPGVRPVLNALSPFVYNPRRTVNLMGELNRELQDFAARRALDTAEGDRVYEERTRPRFKNFVGPILADKATPAYRKIAAAYWELDDARAKLAARVAAAP